MKTAGGKEGSGALPFRQIAAIFLQTLLLFGAIPSAASAQGSGETVKIQDYPGTGNMLFRIAKSKGFCEKHGIACQFQFISTGPLGAQALLSSSIDVALLPAEVQINAAIKGAKLRAITGGLVLNINIIVIGNDVEAPHADQGYPAIMADLKGKKIGVIARGGGTELEFEFLAQKAGFKAEDFHFVAVGAPNTAYGALVSKQVDANITIEPSGALCDVLKTCKTIYRGAETKEPAEVSATNGASGNIVVTQDMIDKKPQLVEALIAAANDAYAFIKKPENYPEALSIAQSYFRFDLARGDEVMDVALKRNIPSYRATVSRPAFQAIADKMFLTKQIESHFDTAPLIYEKAP